MNDGYGIAICVLHVQHHAKAIALTENAALVDLASEVPETLVIQ